MIETDVISTIEYNRKFNNLSREKPYEASLPDEPICKDY